MNMNSRSNHLYNDNKNIMHAIIENKAKERKNKD